MGGCKESKGTQAPGNPVNVAVQAVSYAEHANAPSEVVKKCKFHEALIDAVVEQTPGASKTGGDTTLTMEVVSMRGADPEWQGDISVIVRGELDGGGVTMGTFRVKRTARGGVMGGMGAVCRGLEDIAEQMGEDIAAWLQKPEDKAELGVP